MDDREYQIARLSLEPGDILVVKTDRPKPGHWQDFLPHGVRVLFIPNDMELSVLTKAEIEARAV